MRLSDFDYHLPEELIAQHPLPERSASRLLHCAPDGLHDRLFTDLPRLLRAGDLLVFNDTRVIKARLHGSKASGGRIEALVERVLDARRALAQIRASHAPHSGSVLHFDGGATAEVEAREEGFFVLRFDTDVAAFLERCGELPLPPYITHPADARDEERYQTVLARAPGAVAAPTAGLHFDEALLDELRAGGVGIATLTLHVGAGTFQPVRVENLSEHVMHAERYEIPVDLAERVAATQRAGGRIVAVGTTALRALESAAVDAPPGMPGAALRPGPGETRLFITPGYRFRMVDVLITNFHLPKSTLLMLVSAFAGVERMGVERMRAAYRHAVTQRYRFFSYGDAMLLERNT